MTDINAKEMTFEVILGGVSKGAEFLSEVAQKAMVESFKHAASGDALSQIAGRIGVALPLATVTAAKVVSAQGFNTYKIIVSDIEKKK